MRLWKKIRSLLFKSKFEADMQQEMLHHLAEQTRRNESAGMSPSEARFAAGRQFGNVASIQERAREVRRSLWLEQLGQDSRHAIRALRQQPGFTATVVLTLALGIGANTAIFSVVHGVVLRSLPFQEPASLVRLFAAKQQIRSGATAPDFVDWVKGGQSFEGMSATAVRNYNLTAAGEPERLIGARVSANHFDLLGVTPVLGRTFAAAEDRPGAPPVVLLSYSLWQRRFAGDADVVGRVVMLDREPYTVIGVLPAALEMFAANTQVWTPLVFSAQELASTGARRLAVTARLRPGVSRAQAETEMRLVAAQLEAKRPDSNRGWGVALAPLDDVVVGAVRQPLFILLGAVGLVLVIACANIAGLLLARAETRQQEMAVRAALGAGRGRIARQLLAESLVLVLLGGALGVWLAARGIEGLVLLMPATVPRLGEVGLHPAVLGFTGAVVVVVGLLLGLLPSLHLAKVDLNDALKRGGRSGGSGARPLRRGLVVAEIALAVVLLIGSGLLLKSFRRMQSVDTGLPASPIVSMQLALPEARYRELEQISRFFDATLERLQSSGDVQSAGLTSSVPLAGGGMNISVTILGRPPVPPQQLPVAFYRAVSPGYFHTLGVPVVMGRGLDEHDRSSGPRVAVINQTMARRLWPDEDPVGQRFLLDDDEETPAEVVGVVGDVKHFGPTADNQPEFFVPYAQAPQSFWRFAGRSLGLVVQPRGDTAQALAAVRRAIGSIDADLPVFRVTTLQQLQRDAVALPRVYGTLLGGFALLALLLAAIGIYGIIAYTVAQRQREIGVRIALGADRRDVYRLIIGDGARLALVGAALGLGGAFGLSRVLAAQLFQVSATEPTVFFGVAGLLVLIALVACWLPARRAAKVDPMVALRVE